MMPSMFTFPPLGDELAELQLLEDDLPPVIPHFHVPRLADKPQNPIMDALKLEQHNQHFRAKSLQPSPPPLELVALNNEDLRTGWMSSPELDDIWTAAAQHKIMSWDTLHRPYSSRPSPSPFLSEGSTQQFAMARYHVQPRLQQPDIHILYISLQQLLDSLRMTVLGTSSPLFEWDPSAEIFSLRNYDLEKTVVISIDGKDDLISTGVVRRFLNIGTSLRRLELLIGRLRSRRSNSTPTHHAFTHALSLILDYCRSEIACLTPEGLPASADCQPLSTFWMKYASYEDTLASICTLCNREVGKAPAEYNSLPETPSDLLTLIYVHLESHFESSDCSLATGMLAFILTVASQDYLQSLSNSVGFGISPSCSSNAHVRTSGSPSSDNPYLRNEEEEDLELLDEEEEHEPLPTFIPHDLANVLPRARNSLKFLRTARPDHPILRQDGQHAETRWFWTDIEIEEAWNGRYPTLTKGVSFEENRDQIESSEAPISPSPHPVLSQFRVFDLEPGAQPSQLTSSGNEGSLRAFLAAFPRALPGLTPTLSHLTSLVLSPLLEHTTSLTGALLALFVSPSSYFNFHDHLVLLRSHILLTSWSFRLRLETALFSDSNDAHVTPSRNARSLAIHERKASHAAEEGESQRKENPWAIGLAPGLMDRDTWPPGGADLSFYLRTVIVDSLESTTTNDDLVDSVESSSSQRPQDARKDNARIIQEAEFRLGFAVRDLPAGTGREQWLNPLSIEALDFLYMDYKPPRPLDALITPEVLYRYQRLFTFLLRLMRVENVVRALFRMTRKVSEPLFPTFTASNKLLLNFRFLAHLFVTSLSSYVYDTAIRGNFDAFLARLSRSEEQEDAEGFADVFALAEEHAAVMDDILGACLLRSSHRPVGNLLRTCLELVLDFGTLAGELHRDRLQEYEVVPMLEDLFRSFRTETTALARIIRSMVEKGSTSTRVLLDEINLDRAEGHAPRAPGGTEALDHFLARLDLGEFWKRMSEMNA